MTIDAILRRWPATIHVVIRHGLLCAGCPIAIFHTLADACAAHGLDEATVAADLLGAMRTERPATAPSRSGPDGPAGAG